MNHPTGRKSPFYQPLHCGEGIHRRAQPAPALNSYITYYWEVIIPEGQFNYVALPDTCQHLISLSAPNYSLGQLCLPSLFPLKRQLFGPARLFGISFRPAMRQVFIPVQVEHTEQILSWADLSIPSLTQLEITLRNEPDFHSKIQLVELWLLKQLEQQIIDYSQGQAPLHCAIQSIHQSHGQLSLSEKWAAEQGVSSRHLRRLFLHNLGMTPKQYSDVVRLQSCIQLIDHQGLNALYQSHDYCDESHLIRQFKKFTGVTPRNFINMSVLSKLN
ncbi:helix-turn-helix domain-containing protein [Photobacterium sp. SDRW27]|uniref:helix-turn-helix domain-containing protein n=1 Tax=Photobacterium obscurum TaxID=2829490 RepID=UPI0022440838|nr:helix-turn-helix domain-containing protein [Photobacterium obscurum]MCW8329798.1 helix-turn-helix domain-containing protein [Photobacterium obscurum]